MNRQIKILTIFFILCLLAIIFNLTYIQIFGAEKIEENPSNKRRMVEEYAIDRGAIISSDGQILAQSVDTGTEFRYQRTYPLGALFANIVGYDSWRYGRAGLEQAYNDELMGKGEKLTFRGLANQLWGATNKGNSLILTVDSRLQTTAQEALAGNTGAAVVVDPRTGATLAMATSPTFDPNLVVPLKDRDTSAYWNSINSDPSHPLLDRCLSGLYPPGSSFKVVTCSAALEAGVVNPSSAFDCTGNLEVQGNVIRDFGDRVHGDIDLENALVVSCNNTFAEVGLRLKADKLVYYAEEFGFNRSIPFSLPVATSHIMAADQMSEVDLAWSAIGQAEDLATPLEMALVASGIANKGKIMTPYLVKEIQDYNGKIIDQTQTEQLYRPVSEDVAETVTEFMVDVVEDGTGTAAQIRDVSVAGKTGTAEVENGPPHAWFICFAPSYDPVVAVAVVVEHGGQGGVAAAPIARDILEEAMELYR